MAMSIMIAAQIPLLLILGLLYRKLGRLKKQQMHTGTTWPLPTSHGSCSSRLNSSDDQHSERDQHSEGDEYSERDEYSEGDEYSDEDATEMSDLLHAAPEKKPLEGAV